MFTGSSISEEPTTTLPLPLKAVASLLIDEVEKPPSVPSSRGLEAHGIDVLQALCAEPGAWIMTKARSTALQIWRVLFASEGIRSSDDGCNAEAADAAFVQRRTIS
jgi:hypothetical protein